MLYISLSHLYRIHVDYLGWSLDFTGPQMILTIKLSSFAYNLADGHEQPPKEGSKNYELKKKIYDKRQKQAIKSVRIRAPAVAGYGINQSYDWAKVVNMDWTIQIPNPLEFFGYVYNFTTFLAGPAFEYQMYAKAIDGTAFAKTNGSRPSPILPGLIKLVQVRS